MHGKLVIVAEKQVVTGGDAKVLVFSQKDCKFKGKPKSMHCKLPKMANIRAADIRGTNRTVGEKKG